jgi:hypothetical protein
MTTFQAGDRIEMYSGESISYRADVIAVAKNCSVKIERWWRGLGQLYPVRRREWLPSYIINTAKLIRR